VRPPDPADIGPPGFRFPIYRKGAAGVVPALLVPSVGRSGFFGLVEFVEEAPSLLFIGGAPPFNECEPVRGGQIWPSRWPSRAATMRAPRRLRRGMRVASRVSILARFDGGEGKAVEHLVAALL
jgi:hypothetical protein